MGLSCGCGMNTREQKVTLQDQKKGTERVQTKLGKTHVDYWYARLRKRRFTGRDNLEVEVPDWQIRIKHRGRSMWFNLKTANAAAAAVKAREIYILLIANGWAAVLEKFKPRVEQRENLTVEGFADLYREKMQLAEYPPMKRSMERYISSLFFLCARLGLKRIAQLTADGVKKFVGAYLLQGREEGRDETSVKISCNSHLRGAASMFSKQMLEAIKGTGIELVNPFVGQRLRRIEIRPYTPLQRELLDSIWKNAAKLRDGQPDAPAPPEPSNGKSRKRPKGRRPKRPEVKAHRWKQPDWRKPHPEAYTLLLLELGIGLRREEADKSQWDWLFSDQGGRHFIEVRKTDFFTPKGKRRRIIPVEPVLWDAIEKTHLAEAVFVVPGRLPKTYTPEATPKSIAYRCERYHRTLAAWLRKEGVNDPKPCHLLRKEFGSYVATSFGLFAAQRLLGHSSPSVTEAFYAGLTNLPELRHAQVPAGTSTQHPTADEEPVPPIAPGVNGKGQPSEQGGAVVGLYRELQ